MIYCTEELDSFIVIGQEVELTNSQSQNSLIAKQFWKEFNCNLKNEYLSQRGNWVKYAFMERRLGKLFYFCSIPKNIVVPNGFIEKKIPKQMYLKVEHKGAMNNLAFAYNEIYKQIIPNSTFELKRGIFLHFEKYDHRFHWNRNTSIIEIWIPVCIPNS